MGHLIRLDSGRWYSRVEKDASGTEHLYLSNAERPEDSMRVHLPFSWRDLSEEAVRELARDPELRLWTDALGIQWRIAAVGPGTPFHFPLRERHLVFDSKESWAGITRFEDGHIGDLNDRELEQIRNGISDLGGGRQSFRPPEHLAGPFGRESRA